MNGNFWKRIYRGSKAEDEGRVVPRSYRLRCAGELSVIAAHAAVRFLLFPPRPVTALATHRRIKFLATKSCLEFLRIGGIAKAINVKPITIVINGMTARAERQVSAELVNLFISSLLTKSRRQGDLMRPTSINARRRQLAFPTHVRTAA